MTGSKAYVVWMPFHESRDVLSVLNVADPVNPQTLADREQPGLGIAGIRAPGQFLYVGSYGATTGLHVLDGSDPTNPVRVGGCDPGPLGVAHAAGSRVYVLSNDGMTNELEIPDVGDPQNPTLLGTYSSQSEIAALADGVAAFFRLVKP